MVANCPDETNSDMPETKPTPPNSNNGRQADACSHLDRLSNCSMAGFLSRRRHRTGSLTFPSEGAILSESCTEADIQQDR